MFQKDSMSNATIINELLIKVTPFSGQIQTAIKEKIRVF